ncbi:MAG: hypothetical protein KUG79_19430 [Pseudomonadales bacterium]|nr:hypothetical protein [Pseudomonadales bacterium]
MMKNDNFTHPVLGSFTDTTGGGEWAKNSKTEVLSLGYSFEAFSIIVETPYSSPSEAQINKLVSLLSNQGNLKLKVATAYFEEYKKTIRKNYYDSYLDWTDADWDGKKPDLDLLLPLIAEPESMWSLIDTAYYIWCSEDSSVSFSFLTKYDNEHELHFEFDGENIQRVWHE